MFFNKQSNQEQFNESVDAFGDLLSYEASKGNRTAVVIKGLGELKDLTLEFFDFQRKEPAKFEKLLFSQTFLDIQKKNKREAGLRLWFSPEQHLVALTSLLNQFKKVFDSALKHDNEEVHIQATINLNLILLKLTRIRGQEQIVQQVLRKILHMADKTIEKPKDVPYSASAEWYVEVVLDKYIDKKPFLLEYWGIFNTFFKRNLYELINNSKQELFETVVRRIDQEVHEDDHWTSDFWEYAHLLPKVNAPRYRELHENENIGQLITQLEKLGKTLSGQEELDKLQVEFKKLKDVIYPELTSEAKKEANKVEKKIVKNAHMSVLLLGIKYIFFIAASYSIFKGKPLFVRSIWYALQPADADASHMGFEAYPTSLEELVSVYLGKGEFEDGYETWDGNHGTTKYKRLYFLLLASKLLRETIKDIPQASTNVSDVAEDVASIQQKTDGIEFQLPKLSDPKYRNMIFIIEQIETVISEFITHKEFANVLGVEETDFNYFTKYYLTAFLTRVKGIAQSRLDEALSTKPLSSLKIEKFKSDFIDKYTSSTLLKSLFDDHGTVKDMSTEAYNGEAPLFGLNRLEKREMFFDEWYIDYGNWASEYGAGVGGSEDHSILMSLKKKAETIRIQDIEDKLVSNAHDLHKVALIGDHDFLYDHIVNSDKYFSKWSVERAGEQHERDSLAGYFAVGDVKIPVYNSRSDIGGGVLVDFSQLGTLNYLSPLGEDIMGENLLHFVFSLTDLAGNEQARNDLIQKRYSWLTREGDEGAQHNYLKERMLLKIFERFNISFIDNPLIYFIPQQNEKDEITIESSSTTPK